MNIVVCGTRTFMDRKYIYRKLDHLTKNLDRRKLVVYNGDCKGPDKIAQDWAMQYLAAWKNYKAEWYGKWPECGPIRNREMLKEAVAEGKTVVVAFWDGASKGSADCIKQARKMGLEVRVYWPEEDE